MLEITTITNEVIWWWYAMGNNDNKFPGGPFVKVKKWINLLFTIYTKLLKYFEVNDI